MVRNLKIGQLVQKIDIFEKLKKKYLKKIAFQFLSGSNIKRNYFWGKKYNWHCVTNIFVQQKKIKQKKISNRVYLPIEEQQLNVALDRNTNPLSAPPTPPFLIESWHYEVSKMVRHSKIGQLVQK